MLVLSLLGLNLLLFVLALLWIIIPTTHGLPSKPTKLDRIRKALQMVNLKRDELLYDLGAGDGRVLLIAAKEFGAQAFGVEIGPVQCMWIWLRIAASGLGDKIKIQWGDFFKTDLSKADVVYVYATSREVTKLALYLEKMMKRGSRLVSISADFPEWEPSAFDDESLIFVYEMPPKEGSLTTYLLRNSKE